MQSDDNLGPLVFKHRDIQAHSQEGTRGHYCAPIWKIQYLQYKFLTYEQWRRPSLFGRGCGAYVPSYHWAQFIVIPKVTKCLKRSGVKLFYVRILILFCQKYFVDGEKCEPFHLFFHISSKPLQTYWIYLTVYVSQLSLYAVWTFMEGHRLHKCEGDLFALLYL